VSLILLGLVVMWAVVLIPMWLRRHDEAEEARSVDRFVNAMHTLSRREAKVDPKRYGVVPRQNRDLEVHVSGASAGGGSSRPRRPRKPTVTAADRRRRTLLVLAGLVVVSFILALVVGGTVMWTVQVLLDVALVAFVYYSRRCALAAQARRRPTRRPAPTPRPAGRPAAARPRTPGRVVAPSSATAGADVLFDQTALAERGARQVPVAAEYEPAAAAALFDQEAPPVERIPAAVANPVAGRYAEPFDQEYVEPEVRIIAAPGREVGGVPEEVASAGPVEQERIGGPLWDPVAVPKPSYATKPVAPPRRTRAPIMEPLLPPVEPVAETDEVEDLEEILDRRWAVND